MLDTSCVIRSMGLGAVDHDCNGAVLHVCVFTRKEQNISIYN